MWQIWARNSRYLILSYCLLANTQAAEPGKWQVDLGFGARAGHDIWQSAETFTRFVPVLGLEYGRWSISGAGLAYAVDENPWRVNEISLQYRRYGYNPSGILGGSDSDAPIFEGYNRPPGEWRWSTRFDLTWASLEIEQDISGGSNGTLLNLSSGAPLYRQGPWRVNVGAGVHWQSSRHTQAFFGIDALQANPNVGRNVYTPGAALNLRVGANMSVRVGQRWQLGAGLDMTRFDDAITASPLVEKRFGWRAYAGVRYRWVF